MSRLVTQGDEKKIVVCWNGYRAHVILDPADPFSAIQESVEGYQLTGSPRDYGLAIRNERTGELEMMFGKSIARLSEGAEVELVYHTAWMCAAKARNQMSTSSISTTSTAGPPSSSSSLSRPASSSHLPKEPGATLADEHYNPSTSQSSDRGHSAEPRMTLSPELLPPDLHSRTPLHQSFSSSGILSSIQHEKDRDSDTTEDLPLSQAPDLVPLPNSTSGYPNMRSNIPKGSSTKIQKKVTVFDISSDTSDDDEEPLLRPILISTAKTSNRMNTGIIPKQEADQSPGTPTSNQKKRATSSLTPCSTFGATSSLTPCSTTHSPAALPSPSKRRRRRRSSSLRNDEHNQSVTFTDTSFVDSTGILTRGQRRVNKLLLRTRLEEELERRNNSVHVSWKDSMYYFEGVQTVGQIRTEIINLHRRHGTKAEELPELRDIHIFNWAIGRRLSCSHSRVQMSNQGLLPRSVSHGRSYDSAQKMSLISSISCQHLEAAPLGSDVTSHTISFPSLGLEVDEMEVLVDFSANRNKLGQSDTVMAIWDQIMEVMPSLSPRTHLLRASYPCKADEVNEVSAMESLPSSFRNIGEGPEWTIDLYPHERVRTYQDACGAEALFWLEIVKMPIRKVTLNFKIKTKSHNHVFKKLPATISVAELIEYHIQPLIKLPESEIRLEYHRPNYKNPRESKWEDLTKPPAMLFSAVDDGGFVYLKTPLLRDPRVSTKASTKTPQEVRLDPSLLG